MSPLKKPPPVPSKNLFLPAVLMSPIGVSPVFPHCPETAMDGVAYATDKDTANIINKADIKSTTATFFVFIFTSLHFHKLWKEHNSTGFQIGLNLGGSQRKYDKIAKEKFTPLRAQAKNSPPEKRIIS